MGSRWINDIWEAYLEQLRIDEKDNNILEFQKFIQALFDSESAELHLDELMLIFQKLILKFSHKKSAKILQRALENTTFTPSRLTMFGCLLQNIFERLVREQNLNQKMIEAYLPVVKFLLFRVNISTSLRLHMICHLIWALKPILNVETDRGCVAQVFLKNFVRYLDKCNLETRLSVPNLLFLFEVVALMANEIIFSIGPELVDDIFYSALDCCNEEIKWILWWAIGRAFLNILNGCFRGGLSTTQERFFNRLIQLSINLEDSINAIPAQLQKEVTEFYQKLKENYCSSSNELLKYEQDLRGVGTCLSSGCEFSTEEVQILEENGKNIMEGDVNAEETVDGAKPTAAAAYCLPDITDICGAKPHKEPPTYSEVEDLIRSFLNSNPDPLYIYKLKCLIDCACVDDSIYLRDNWKGKF